MRACCLRTESILCWFIQHYENYVNKASLKAYYHLRWTRIPRDTRKGLIIRNTLVTFKHAVSRSQHRRTSRCKCNNSAPLVSEVEPYLNPTTLANFHCLETQDIHYKCKRRHRNTSFHWNNLFPQCRLSGCRLGGMSAHLMSAPWNRLGNNRLSGMTPYYIRWLVNYSRFGAICGVESVQAERKRHCAAIQKPGCGATDCVQRKSLSVHFTSGKVLQMLFYYTWKIYKCAHTARILDMCRIL